MAHRRTRNRKPRQALTDITLYGTQTFIHPEYITRGRMPSTPTNTRVPQNAWVPLTPPSLGRCTRSRSQSMSPKNKNKLRNDNNNHNNSLLDDSVTPGTSASSSLLSSSLSHSGKGQTSTPRKRLLLSSSRSPLFDKSVQNSPKKFKLDLSVRTPSSTAALEGLSREQLVTLIGNLVSGSNELEQKLQQLLPEPDLKPIEKELKYLRLSILRSLPSRHSLSDRLTSRTDAVAFSRAHVHLLNFQKYLMTSGKSISNSKHWNSVVDFVFTAWHQTKLTPNWEKKCHNDIKFKCFKFLAHQLAEALQSESFSSDELEQILNELTPFLADSGEIRCCVSILENKLSQRNASPSRRDAEVSNA